MMRIGATVTRREWKKDSEELKEVFWKACRSYNIADYNDAMKEMSELSADAVEELNQQNSKAFSRCFLNSRLIRRVDDTKTVRAGLRSVVG